MRPMSVHWPGQQGFARIARIEGLPSFCALCASEFEDGKVWLLQLLKSRHNVGIGFIEERVGGADVQRQWEGMISYIWRIVTGRAGAGNLLRSRS